MEFTIEREELLQGLYLTQGIVERRTGSVTTPAATTAANSLIGALSCPTVFGAGCCA